MCKDTKVTDFEMIQVMKTIENMTQEHSERHNDVTFATVGVWSHSSFHNNLASPEWTTGKQKLPEWAQRMWQKKQFLRTITFV